MVVRLPPLQWNWNEFCGVDNFTVWTSTHEDLTQCFQVLCLQIPILSIIAITSAFYAGKYEQWMIRTSREKFIIKIRTLVVLLLASVPAIRITIQVINDSKSLYIINYWFTITESFTWFVHFCYVSALRNRLGFSLRGPVLLGSLWTMFYVTCIFRTRSIYLMYEQDKTREAFLSLEFSVLMILLQTVYGLTLIPPEDGVSRRHTIDSVDQDDVDPLSQYARFREDFDPQYLGTALEGSGAISRFLFLWVNRLMRKGVKGQLHSSEDVFDLPDDLTCSKLYDKLKISLTNTNQVSEFDNGQVSLLRGLHRCFAKEFYGIGVLKFIADIAGFASPLLLHQLLTFIEDETVPVSYGYFYGFGIFFASFVGSFCNVHFDFCIGKISLKMQGSLISKIYRKILCLSPAICREVSVGEIVNHISTDMDRISNSCISFHAVWSIPFQLGVTLYLLYTQVGVAFVAGLIFSVILIPINKIIAMKIVSLSRDMMSEKDKRVQAMSELIKGIRVIKLHVWEEYFISKVLGIRVKEIKYLKGRKYLDALCVYFWATTPVIISIITFTVYIYLGGKLNAAIVFTSLALLNMLIAPLNAFPWVLNGVIEAWISIKRVNSFLQLEEVNSIEFYSSKSDDTKSIVIKDGSFSWTFVKLQLSNVNLSVEKGQLVGIVGSVGSGKSSLLAALMGEIQRLSGSIYVDSIENGIGYVSQTAWIQHCSIRENILFGKPFDPARYKIVVEACALMEDFNNWTKSDFEIVGEGGSTLSGGQKARIALARAVYQDRSLYLLDDVLSAVDAEVAVHIYNECIKKLLHGATRIVVSHHAKLFASADLVVVLEDGKILKQGPPNETLVNIEEFQPTDDKKLKNEKINDFEKNRIRDDVCDNELEKEISESGAISFSVYIGYWKAVGNFLVILILLSIVAMQISRQAVDWWLSVWISANTDFESNKTDSYYLNKVEHYLVNDHAADVYYFLRVYVAIGIANSIIVIARAFLFAYGGIRAATRIHKMLLRSITSAKIEFFDVTPLGRILNRFSSDTNIVDDTLPFDINILLAQFFAVLGILFIAVYGIPWLCLILAPLIPVYHWLQSRYRLTSRELKRLASVTLSPLYSHVTETISGISTIRAFNESIRFIRENEDKVDSYLKCSFSGLAAQVWLNIRLQFMAVLIIGSVCVIAVLQRHFDVAHSGFVGLAISYALSLTGCLSGVIGIFTETERQMVAMERINEYIRKPKREEYDCKIDIALPFAWPSQGIVSFMDVCLRYRNDIVNSLRNVTFETHPGEKIGIVGRTGAGKSSLFATLLRLTDLNSGVISIDAINIANIPLRKLRSKITIIPQDPFIFAGTISENIDPLHEHGEFGIWDAANRCGLVPLIQKLGGINAMVQSGGVNLSVGERQLLCLVRAVLRNAKVVCIDEASANVDEETDKQIQDVIRSSFKYSTVFTIAHRVQSVMDSDRIIVMDHGEILEFDSPQTLLQDPESKFYKLVDNDIADSQSD